MFFYKNYFCIKSWMCLQLSDSDNNEEVTLLGRSSKGNIQMYDSDDDILLWEVTLVGAYNNRRLQHDDLRAGLNNGQHSAQQLVGGTWQRATFSTTCGRNLTKGNIQQNDCDVVILL